MLTASCSRGLGRVPLGVSCSGATGSRRLSLKSCPQTGLPCLSGCSAKTSFSFAMIRPSLD